MTRFAFTVEFDGRPFMGWQRQAHGPSVQQAIEDAKRRAAQELAEKERREAEELARLRVARDTFLSTLERVCGRTIPADHPLRVDPPRVPTYSCLSCQDLGWVREGNRVRHCRCWSYNPILERHRADARLRHARRQGR